MKGRAAILDTQAGREMAALMVDGRITDLFLDPVDGDDPQPEAIYMAEVERPMKGQGGVILSLGNGVKGFLKQAKGLSQGDRFLVQVSNHPEEGKAALTSPKILFKGRYAILTPGAPGVNVARSIKDEEIRESLLEIAHNAMVDAPDGFGLILRSSSLEGEGDEIDAEIQNLLQTAQAILAETGENGAELLLDAPTAHHLAWREWNDIAENAVFSVDGSFEDHGVWEEVEALHQPYVPLPGGCSMYVEQTRALIAVDVNTGGDFSHAAGLKANLAVARELPRQLSLRGLGGQIVIDFAPMSKKDRRQVEQVLKKALRADGVDTITAGWTPLGHLELQRKRDRLPIAEQKLSF